MNSGSWWWTGRPGVLWFMGSQRVRHDWATALNWTVQHGERYSTSYNKKKGLWCWERLKGGGEGHDRGCDGWMAPPTQWIWVGANSRSLPKLLSIESGMPSNNLILCHPLLLLPSIFPSIRVFSNESALRIRWPKYWNKQPNLHLKQLEKEEEEQQQKHKKPPQLVEGKKS